MDFQRSLLIGAIVVLSFMLLTEWVSFTNEQKASVAKETAHLTTNNGSSGQAISTGSTLTADDNTINEDLPSAPTGPDEAPATNDQSAASATDIVLVETDVIHLAIDLRGGDIIELSLPKHLAQQDEPDSPLVLLEQNNQLVYIAQSGLVGEDGIDSNGRAQYRAASNHYVLKDGEQSLTVDLLWQNDAGIKVTKRLTLHRDDYLIDVDFLITNNSKQRWVGNLFGQIKRGSAPPPSADSNAMGLKPFLGVATTQPDDRFTKFSFDEIADEPFKAQLPGGWIAMVQHYFISAWIPDSQASHTYSARVTRSGYNIAGFTAPVLAIDPGQTGQVGASFYAGPKDQYRLREISPYLDLVVDYGWLWWIAQPLFWLLTKIQSVVGNWGVAIILLTVLIKGLFFRLSASSYKSMANMRRVQPKLLQIREEYAEDKQKQSQAMMELYRKEKINPLGGCLPILVQMPVFIGLYWMLMESVELRHAPFMLWIKDLSVMDPYFVLPLLMGASMFFMQKLNPPPPDPMQAKIMQWMPVMFTFFFLWFPAGLVLYWVVNNLLSMAQQFVITRRIEKADSRT